MIRLFQHYTDPGHGWIKVPVKLLKSLGIEGKISTYSYRLGEYAYLEEDSDASLFLESMSAAGEEFKFVTKHTNKQSKIRNYYPY